MWALPINQRIINNNGYHKTGNLHLVVCHLSNPRLRDEKPWNADSNPLAPVVTNSCGCLAIQNHIWDYHPKFIANRCLPKGSGLYLETFWQHLWRDHPWGCHHFSLVLWERQWNRFFHRNSSAPVNNLVAQHECPQPFQDPDSVNKIQQRWKKVQEHGEFGRRC